MPRMNKTEEDWNGLKLWFLKPVQPNSFSELIPVACNFQKNAQETYLLVSDLWSLILSFTFNFFAYFQFHSDGGRVIGKIKQSELDCRDTALLKWRPYTPNPILNCIFDLVSNNKNPGTTKSTRYLQWLYTKTCSLLRKFKVLIMSLPRILIGYHWKAQYQL